MAEAVEKALNDGNSQYFMKPHVIVDAQGEPIGAISDGDAVIFCCRRGEREVQLTRAFVDPSFQEFPTAKFKELNFVTMTRYHEMFKDVPVAFPPAANPENTLGEVFSRSNLRQLRIAESEKFAHVTFFLNGGRHEPFPGEDHVCVPSLKNVAFDDVPEMKSESVTQAVVEGMMSPDYHFIAVNLANGDIIGHLNNFEAKIRCAEALDACLGIMLETAHRQGIVVIVTADHGLLEKGYDSDGYPNLHHTRSPVPLVLVHPSEKNGFNLDETGILADVAPTMLELMGLSKPGEMTGRSLLRKRSSGPIGGKRVVLIIMDGWGIGLEDNSNPIYVGETPVWNKLMKVWPQATLRCSGEAVGLQKAKPGNSEAGHMNIGAGRVVIQDDVRIAQALENSSFESNEAFLEAINGAKRRESALHLITMLSNRSSHGSLDYPLALVRLARKHGLKRVFIHTIFNRPYRTETAPNLLRDLAAEMETIGVGEIATGVGRGLALDRDGDYQKTKRAYDALVFGSGIAVKS